jgi:hypothetical protein
MADTVEIKNIEQLNRVLDYVGKILKYRIENGHSVELTYENITGAPEAIDHDSFKHGIDAFLEQYKPGYITFAI